MKASRILTLGILAVLVAIALAGVADFVRSSLLTEHGAASATLAGVAVLLAVNSVATQLLGGYRYALFGKEWD